MSKMIITIEEVDNGFLLKCGDKVRCASSTSETLDILVRELRAMIKEVKDRADSQKLKIIRPNEPV